MEVDIYDFDKTVIPFDSGSRFALFCAIHYPWCFITLPVILVGFLLSLCKIISFTQFKKVCFMFVPMVPLKKAVKKFWDKYENTVHPWFYEKNRYRIIISASPDFLLEEIAERLEFDELICTRHNAKTGAIISNNCNKEEKVRRLYELHNKEDIKVIDVYSDSLELDEPIFSLANGQCYHIVKSEKVPFNYDEVYNNKPSSIRS